MFVNLYILIRCMSGKAGSRATLIGCMLLLLMSASMSALAQDSIHAKKPKAQLRREMMERVQTNDTTSSKSGINDDSVQDSISSESTVPTEEDNSRPVEEDGNQPAIALDVDAIDSVALSHLTTLPSADSLANAIKAKFVPDPKKALWLAIVFPGGGQIYNRKYWKLPLIYGGFLGCVYALSWNNMMYRDYSQAYVDIMDSDPNTNSYENFIPKGYDISTNLTRIQDLFRRKKNYYRRYRDLSMFCMIGVYALSIIDAYVDAELSSFDISKDLSMKVRPSIIQDRSSVAAVSQSHNPYASQSYGVQCSLNF